MLGGGCCWFVLCIAKRGSFGMMRRFPSLSKERYRIACIGRTGWSRREGIKMNSSLPSTVTSVHDLCWISRHIILRCFASCLPHHSHSGSYSHRSPSIPGKNKVSILEPEVRWSESLQWYLEALSVRPSDLSTRISRKYHHKKTLPDPA